VSSRDAAKALSMKKLMYACMAIIALGNIAMADLVLPAVPKKFQGTWTDVYGGGSMTIDANTVSFGGFSDKLKLISIEPGDEERNRVIVKWSTNPGVNVTATVWHLIRVNGREVLFDVNEQSPSSKTLYLKR
jgi:hypothetical protein